MQSPHRLVNETVRRANGKILSTHQELSFLIGTFFQKDDSMSSHKSPELNWNTPAVGENG